VIWVAVLASALTARAASLALDKQPVLLGKTESVGVSSRSTSRKVPR
jgi:hypothetical protein